MTTSHWSDSFTGGAPVWALGGLALGGGLAAGRHLLKGLKRDPVDSTVGMTELEPSVARLPVPVTPEEAAELEKDGVRVKRASSFVNALGLGALGTTAALGGWALTNHLFDKDRKEEARKRVQQHRLRLQKIMEDEPAAPDLQLHAQMKAAEDLYGQHLAKQAGIGGFVDSIAPTPVGALLGSGLVLAGLHGYQRYMEQDKSEAKAKAIREALRQRKPEAPTVVMEPVLVRKSDQA